MIGSPPRDFYKPSPEKRRQQREDGIALLIGVVFMALWAGSMWLDIWRHQP